SLLTREPGGTELGEQIKHLLQFSAAGELMMPETELLLFAASRAQLVREIIAPALAGGTTVIADRFFDSTTVYQGVARKLDRAAVKFVNEFAIGSCKPDITFLLDLDTLAARDRLNRRTPNFPFADRMESEPMDFYERVRRGYLELAEGEQTRIRVIEASRSPEEIETTIWNQLAPFFS
ncbi:MAG: dTMP kinase, partial [Verrucomicrobiota bacterium]|nr:dTMP kinase [Verrucomicrobiota bacterium]